MSKIADLIQHEQEGGAAQFLMNLEKNFHVYLEKRCRDIFMNMFHVVCKRAADHWLDDLVR